MRMVDGVDGGIVELLELLALLLLLKNTPPLPFGWEHDGLGGALVSIPGDAKNKKLYR